VLVLASASPRRRELLARLCQRFEVMPSAIEERLLPGPLAGAVAALALEKARTVAARLAAGVVLAADTVVAIGGDVLGKPADVDEARRMLRRLRGRAHDVITGLAGCRIHGPTVSTAVASRVLMANYPDDVLEAYVASGSPLDKAGAYAIQDLDGRLVDGLVGSYTNVIGLPLAATRLLLEDLSVDVSGGAMPGV
jgi:septum formation protein